MRRPARAAAAMLLLAGASCTGAQSMLDTAGPDAARIATLWWVMFALSIVVLVGIGGMLGIALFRKREGAGEERLPDPDDIDVHERDPRALDRATARKLVIYGGVAIPAVLLLFLLVYSVAVGTQTHGPVPDGALRIELTGHMFWWEVRYPSAEPSRDFRTANEIRIPVGRPIHVVVRSADVIHSFWVPNLHGKIDMIPGRENQIVIQADRPGVFRGQCAEFCGVQHAKMALYVVAQPEPEFEAWRDRHIQPATPPTDPLRREGERVFLERGCGACHMVRGTRAMARVAPDLTHFGTRLSVGAATLPNRPGHLAGWIADPQGAKPGNFMPAIPLTGEELNAVVAYLLGLR